MSKLQILIRTVDMAEDGTGLKTPQARNRAVAVNQIVHLQPLKSAHTSLDGAKTGFGT